MARSALQLWGRMYQKRFIHVLLLIMAMICTSALPNGAAVVAQASRVEHRKLRSNDKIFISNQSGPITVTGWDRDYVEATATNQRRGETVPVKIIEEGAGVGRLLIAPTLDGRRKNEMRLDVNLPRSARIELVSTLSGDVEITGIDGPIKIDGGSGSLKVSKIKSLNAVTGTGSISVSETSGSVDVETIAGDISGKDIKGDFVAKMRTGNVLVDNVFATVNLIVASGDVRVSRVGGDVHIVSISASMNVRCVTGLFEASSVNAPIMMSDIYGDIDATTTSGDIEFTGVNRAGGSYRLKSQSGDILMVIRSDAPGFTATLLSNTSVTTDFPLNADPSLPRGPDNRRLSGRYGDGRAQITLDSYRGSVKLNRAAPGAVKDCTSKN